MARKMDDWEIKMMAPPLRRHRKAAMRLSLFFSRYLEGRPCEIYAEVPVLISDDIRDKFKERYESEEKRRFPAKYFIPDLAVICNPEIDKENHVEGAPDIVIEILSKKTMKIDRGIKKEIYAEIGVPEYWVVDPDGEWIEIFDLTGGTGKIYTDDREENDEGETEGDEPVISPLKFPELEIKVNDIFR
jgi:Uma2 family endonuclease